MPKVALTHLFNINRFPNPHDRKESKLEKRGHLLDKLALLELNTCLVGKGIYHEVSVTPLASKILTFARSSPSHPSFLTDTFFLSS
jgi:hypothetical protein